MWHVTCTSETIDHIACHYICEIISVDFSWLTWQSHVLVSVMWQSHASMLEHKALWSDVY